MCKFNLKSGDTRIDPCIEYLIVILNREGIKTLACCCGHFKYHLTIIAKTRTGKIYDILSQVDIPRKKRFYKRDKQGYYYIPEVKKYWKNKTG